VAVNLKLAAAKLLGWRGQRLIGLESESVTFSVSKILSSPHSLSHLLILALFARRL